MRFGKSSDGLLRVKFLTSIASATFSYAPGAVVDLPQHQARGWVKSGVVELAPDAELGKPPAPGCLRCGGHVVLAGLCASCVKQARSGGR
jgi:hypothetical protein